MDRIEIENKDNYPPCFGELGGYLEFPEDVKQGKVACFECKYERQCFRFSAAFSLSKIADNLLGIYNYVEANFSPPNNRINRTKKAAHKISL